MLARLERVRVPRQGSGRARERALGVEAVPEEERRRGIAGGEDPRRRERRLEDDRRERPLREELADGDRIHAIGKHDGPAAETIDATHWRATLHVKLDPAFPWDRKDTQRVQILSLKVLGNGDFEQPMQRVLQTLLAAKGAREARQHIGAELIPRMAARGCLYGREPRSQPIEEAWTRCHRWRCRRVRPRIHSAARRRSSPSR